MVLLTSPVGAGKTTLAVHAAHRVATKFFPLFEAGGDHDAWQHTHDIALAACEKAGNVLGAAVLRCSLASLHISQSRYDLAHEMTLLAKDVFEDLGELAGRTATSASSRGRRVTSSRPGGGTSAGRRCTSGSRTPSGGRRCCGTCPRRPERRPSGTVPHL
ncbi:hypothetical protein C8D87_105510 [Lentzea atacamensis]|uniref:Uncharacterized protein n=1 Tax=Lentzea atacamensis TaxID=531938 RepID=A0ABX9E6K5_9PSEU|nr:hypothetical protein [Lentzea atacamensis]RAS65015.1 hypothetical protein C8D87_105510 [Lentzea atacamensis]